MNNRIDLTNYEPITERKAKTYGTVFLEQARIDLLDAMENCRNNRDWKAYDTYMNEFRTVSWELKERKRRDVISKEHMARYAEHVRKAQRPN